MRTTAYSPLILMALLLAACEPTWQGTTPVTLNNQGRNGGSCGNGVTIVSGDTVYSVARRCNVSVRELIETNRLQAPYALQAGAYLRMPGPSGEYVVQKGDSLSVIAKKLRVDFRTLAEINRKTEPYAIYPGEKLRIPTDYRDDSPRTARATEPSPSRPTGVAAAPLPPPPPVPAVTGKNPPLSQTEPERTVSSSPVVTLPNPPALAGKGFIWPVKGEVLAEFGPIAKGQNNDGINISAVRGTPIRASENGVVAYVGNEIKGFGNLLLIKHSDGWMTAYAHADQISVKKGDVVKRGQQVGTVGVSGNVSAPQLHFELRRGTEVVNPRDHLS